MSDTRKSLPPQDDKNFSMKVREALDTYIGVRGNPLDRGVTVGDLVDANMATLAAGYLAGGGAGGRTGRFSGRVLTGPGTAPIEPDLSPPPNPTGFAATTSKTKIQITCDPQTYPQGHGHGQTVVYGYKYTAGDPLPTFGQAIELTRFQGDVFAFSVDPADDFRLWIKWATVDGVLSTVPAGGTNGLTAVAGLLDSANIAELTASKIRSGSISVGESIYSANYVVGVSGWRIDGSGTMFMNNAVVRGGVYASYGTFTGDISGSNGNFNGEINVGSYTGGYAWPAGMGTGAHLGAGGLLLGNPSTGKYFQFDVGTGNIYAPQFSIVAGAATFTGNIRLGALTAYPGIGSRYPVELNADGTGFFARNVISGGRLLASGTEAMADAWRPAVLFLTVGAAPAPPPPDYGGLM